MKLLDLEEFDDWDNLYKYLDQVPGLLKEFCDTYDWGLDHVAAELAEFDVKKFDVMAWACGKEVPKADVAYLIFDILAKE